MLVSGYFVAVLTPFRLSFYLLYDPPKDLTDVNFFRVGIKRSISP